MPEATIDQKETSRLVKEILDVLPDEQRIVIGMFYYDQMSVSEIAEELECSENTVKSRLNYGRKKFRLKFLNWKRTEPNCTALHHCRSSSGCLEICMNSRIRISLTQYVKNIFWEKE